MMYLVQHRGPKANSKWEYGAKYVYYANALRTCQKLVKRGEARVVDMTSWKTISYSFYSA